MECWVLNASLHTSLPVTPVFYEDYESFSEACQSRPLDTRSVRYGGDSFSSPRIVDLPPLWLGERGQLMLVATIVEDMSHRPAADQERIR
jgi:hypothetical protein